MVFTLASCSFSLLLAFSKRVQIKNRRETLLLNSLFPTHLCQPFRGNKLDKEASNHSNAHDNHLANLSYSLGFHVNLLEEEKENFKLPLSKLGKDGVPTSCRRPELDRLDRTWGAKTSRLSLLVNRGKGDNPRLRDKNSCQVRFCEKVAVQNSEVRRKFLFSFF